MSNNKKILFKDEAKNQILEGMRIVCEAVQSTIGPSGATVLIQSNTDSATITSKDGVTVAKSINLKNKFHNMGAQAIKEAASRSVDNVGDGTTSTSILCFSIYELGLKLIRAGFSATEIKKGIDYATLKVIENLDKMSIPVENEEQILNIGTISSNGDKNIAKIVAEAIKKVGSDGIITIEESKKMEIGLDIVDGMQIDNRGFLSSYFINNNEKMSCEFEDCYVLVTNNKFSGIEENIKFFEKIHNLQKPILIIADEVEGETLQLLISNRLRNSLNSCPIRAPGFGPSRDFLLEDIALLTGAKVISASTGLKVIDCLNDVSILGKAKKITVNKNKTIIVGHSNVKENVEKRIEELRISLKDPTLTENDKNLLKERLSKLSGGVVQIFSGGITESEMKERKDRIEDCLAAVKAATKGGILAGGGVSLIRASEDIDRIDFEASQSFKSAIKLVQEACEAPFRKLIENTGKSPDVVLNKIKESKDLSFGYNALTEKYENLIESGVVDPVLVTKEALKNASSIASLLLTVDCIIVSEDEN